MEFASSKDNTDEYYARSYARSYPAAAGVPGVQRFFDDATRQPIGAATAGLPQPIERALKDALAQELSGDPETGFQILWGALKLACYYAESVAELDVGEYCRLMGASQVNKDALSVAEIDAYLAARDKAGEEDLDAWLDGSDCPWK